MWLLLAAVLFLRAFVPAGTMPERDDGGFVAVHLCNSDGVWLIPLGKADSGPAKGENRGGEPCAFAGLGSPIVPPPDLPAFALPGPGAESFAPVRAFAALPPQQSLPPPARGPPLPA